MTTLLDRNTVLRVAGASRNVLELLQYFFTLNKLAEDYMVPVQKVGLVEGDKKLGAVGVGTAVGHAEETSLVVLNRKVLVWEACDCTL